MTTLYLISNNLISENLNLLNLLPNLESLWIGSNPLIGSLQSFQKLIRLKKLHINQTNLTTGLEYLPLSLEEFYCRETELSEQLINYGKTNLFGNHIELVQNWKESKANLLWRNWTSDRRVEDLIITASLLLN
jgi:Leucine-rich repeat (LRR) protein